MTRARSSGWWMKKRREATDDDKPETLGDGGEGGETQSWVVAGKKA